MSHLIPEWGRISSVFVVVPHTGRVLIRCARHTANHSWPATTGLAREPGCSGWAKCTLTSLFPPPLCCMCWCVCRCKSPHIKDGDVFSLQTAAQWGGTTWMCIMQTQLKLMQIDKNTPAGDKSFKEPLSKPLRSIHSRSIYQLLQGLPFHKMIFQ